MTRQFAVGLVLLFLLVASVAGLLVARSFVYIPVLNDGAAGIYDASSLPESLHVCGRSWSKSAQSVPMSRADITGATGLAPIVVEGRQFAACPAGACSTSGTAPCATVIYVRTGDDAYFAYSLRGGP